MTRYRLPAYEAMIRKRASRIAFNRYRNAAIGLACVTFTYLAIKFAEAIDAAFGAFAKWVF